MTILSLFTCPVITQAEKTKIETAADLPRVDFKLQGKPSEILQKRGSLLDELMASVEADATGLLEQYEINDGRTRARLLNSLYTVAFLRKDWQRVLELGARVREAETKRSSQLLTNQSTDAWAAAALQTGDEDSKGFRESLAREYRSRLEPLPYKVVQDSLEASASQFDLLTPDLIEGQVIAQLDPNAEARQLTVNRGIASAILNIIRTAEMVEYKDIYSSIQRNYLDANAEEKEDLWSARLIDLTGVEGLSPVVTTVWDSGTDVDLFPNQRWINKAEKQNGADEDGNGFPDDISGIAFDVKNKPTTGSLLPLPESDYEDLESSLDWIVGSMDLQANIDSGSSRKIVEPRSAPAGLSRRPPWAGGLCGPL